MPNDPRVDTYLDEKAAPFARPILAAIRAAVHNGREDIAEDIKWGAPAFLWNGHTICVMAAFKHHAALSFMRDKELDFAAVGLEPGEEGRGQLGKIDSETALPTPAAIAKLVGQAIALAQKQRPKTKAKPVKVPPVPKPFADALAAHPQAKAVFDGFPPGARRDYVEWITEAKRDATRNARVAQAVEWLADGKKRHWKYENC